MFEEKNHEKRKNCEIGSNQGSMEDMISELPKDLICGHILSRLRTADAVKTSALSTNWRNLWKSVPHLGLHSDRFSTSNEFLTFISKFLYFHKDPLIRKFQLRIFERDFKREWLHGLYMNDDDCYATQWMDEVLTRHEIQHLDFSYGNYASTIIIIPLSLYTCETLVHLRLVGVTMVDSEFILDLLHVSIRPFRRNSSQTHQYITLMYIMMMQSLYICDLRH